MRPFELLQQSSTHYELALAEHERRHVQLREANERLVLAVLSARELQAVAERALQRQLALATGARATRPEDLPLPDRE